MSLDVNRDVDTSGQIELLEFVDCRSSGLDDVNEPFVRANLELIHRLFVNVDGTIHGELLDLRRKRDGPSNASAGALSCLDNVRCGLVDNAIIKAF